MKKSDFVTTEIKLFIDGLEVVNFFPHEVQLIRTDAVNSSSLLKRFTSFSGIISLTQRQKWRLVLLVLCWAVQGLVQGRGKVKKKVDPP